MTCQNSDAREIDRTLGCIWFTIMFWGFIISYLLNKLLEQHR